MDTAPSLMLLVLLTAAACDEHGQSPTFVRCSPKWLSVIEQCEELCVDPDVLTTDTSCWRGTNAENATTCEPNRFAGVNGHRGCCVFVNARVEFVECNTGTPPDAPDLPDAPIGFPD